MLGEIASAEASEFVWPVGAKGEGTTATVEIEDENGIRALANRKFFKSAEKEDLFTSVSSLDATVPVNFVFLGAENSGRSFKVPAGVYVGAYTGENAYEFFRDEACTVPYSYLDEKITEELTIYVKAK